MTSRPWALLFAVAAISSACAAKGRISGSAHIEGNASTKATLDVHAQGASSVSVAGGRHEAGTSGSGERHRHSSALTTAPALPTDALTVAPLQHESDLNSEARASPFRIVRDGKGYEDRQVKLGRVSNIAAGFHANFFFTVSAVDVDQHFTLEGKYDRMDLFGRWPDATFLSTKAPYGEETIQRWDPKTSRFTLVAKDRGLYGAVPWKNGSILGLERTGMHYLPRPEGIGARFTVLAGSAGAPSPPRVNGRGKCLKNADVLAFDALPSGEIYALVQECSHVAPPHELNIQRWDKNGARTIERAPGIEHLQVLAVDERRGGDVAAVSPHEVYVVINALKTDTFEPQSYLVRFDGKIWKRLEVSVPFSLTSVDVDREGKIWLTAFNDPKLCTSPRGVTFNCIDGQLLRVDPKTLRHEVIQLPFVIENNEEPLIPYAVRAYDDGIWVAAKTTASQRHALLYTRPD